MSDESKNNPHPSSEIILYQTEDGRSRIEVRLENETVTMLSRNAAGLRLSKPPRSDISKIWNRLPNR